MNNCWSCVGVVARGHQPTERPTDVDLRGSNHRHAARARAHTRIHAHTGTQKEGESKVHKRNGPFGFYNLQQVGRFNR